MWKLRLVLGFAAILLANPAAAVLPGEMLADPALESRARDISRNLRCLVCQNQSIDDSSAGVARDLRLLVRERLQAGDSDRLVVQYVVDRYGDFVLLKPQFKPSNYALWFGPGLILAGAAAAVVIYLRRQAGRSTATAAAPLSETEKRRLEEIMREGST
jgi:cytochrome c-type biogenesis protein CcmH